MFVGEFFPRFSRLFSNNKIKESGENLSRIVDKFLQVHKNNAKYKIIQSLSNNILSFVMILTFQPFLDFSETFWVFRLIRNFVIALKMLFFCLHLIQYFFKLSSADDDILASFSRIVFFFVEKNFHSHKTFNSERKNKTTSSKNDDKLMEMKIVRKIEFSNATYLFGPSKYCH